MRSQSDHDVGLLVASLSSIAMHCSLRQGSLAFPEGLLCNITDFLFGICCVDVALIVADFPSVALHGPLSEGSLVLPPAFVFDFIYFLFVIFRSTINFNNACLPSNLIVLNCYTTYV